MSMTLAQMASFITGKVGQYDDVSLRLCKNYINARYKMVWDDYFWRDSQITTTVTLPSGESFFDYPPDVDRIVTLRADPDIFLDPIDETFLIETDPTILERGGTPQFYSEFLAPFEGVGDEFDPGTLINRVKVYPIAKGTFTIYIFGKRKCPEMTFDEAVSALRNCDNVIIAYAMGDMLERLRQYAKAQAKFQEAKALLDEAKGLETTQANKARRNKNLTVVGNSLLEMTDAVCGICNSWTPDIRILVREFLRRNYVALYDMTLWPESTVVVRVPFTGEQVILPHFVDRVEAVRSSDGTNLMPNELTYILNVNPGIFEQTGPKLSFSMLTPVGVGLLPPSAEPLQIASSALTDAAKRVFVRGESNGTEVIEEVVLDGVNPVYTKYAYNVPLTVGKDITDGDVTVNSSTTDALLELIPANERERKHLRLWLLPPPKDCNATDTCLVLGKRKITPLRSDEDTPIISGGQRVMIAGAAADLFTRLGNAADAATYRTMADQAAKVLLNQNTDQNAYAPKLVPMIEPSPLGWYGGGECWSKE